MKTKAEIERLLANDNLQEIHKLGSDGHGNDYIAMLSEIDSVAAVRAICHICHNHPTTGRTGIAALENATPHLAPLLIGQIGMHEKMALAEVALGAIARMAKTEQYLKDPVMIAQGIGLFSRSRDHQIAHRALDILETLNCEAAYLDAMSVGAYSPSEEVARRAAKFVSLNPNPADGIGQLSMIADEHASLPRAQIAFEGMIKLRGEFNSSCKASEYREADKTIYTAARKIIHPSVLVTKSVEDLTKLRTIMEKAASILPKFEDMPDVIDAAIAFVPFKEKFDRAFT